MEATASGTVTTVDANGQRGGDSPQQWSVDGRGCGGKAVRELPRPLVAQTGGRQDQHRSMARDRELGAISPAWMVLPRPPHQRGARVSQGAGDGERRLELIRQQLDARRSRRTQRSGGVSAANHRPATRGHRRPRTNRARGAGRPAITSKRLEDPALENRRSARDTAQRDDLAVLARADFRRYASARDGPERDSPGRTATKSSRGDDGESASRISRSRAELRRVDYAPMWSTEFGRRAGVFAQGQRRCQRLHRRLSACGGPLQIRLARDLEAPLRHRRVEWVRQWSTKVYLEFQTSHGKREGARSVPKADRAISLGFCAFFAAASLSPRRFCRPHYRIADKPREGRAEVRGGIIPEFDDLHVAIERCWTMPRWTPRPRPCTRRTWSKPAAAAASIYSATTTEFARRECVQIDLALDRNSYSHQSQVTSPQSSHKVLSRVASPQSSRLVPSPFAILRGHHRLNSSAHEKSPTTVIRRGESQRRGRRESDLVTAS